MNDHLVHVNQELNVYFCTIRLKKIKTVPALRYNKQTNKHTDRHTCRVSSSKGEGADLHTQPSEMHSAILGLHAEVLALANRIQISTSKFVCLPTNAGLNIN